MKAPQNTPFADPLYFTVIVPWSLYSIFIVADLETG
nr:MAG TPA: hypothetical protein [Caudoviricetes sp.]